LRQGVEILHIFTHEDSPAEKIWFSSVRELAHQHDIPCLTTDINEPDNIERVRLLRPDFIFSFYYRSMLKPHLLEIPTAGALNMHGSYLPRYRGRVPVNWAVIHGETETGATLHYMVEKPDAGDIVDQQKVPILFSDTACDVFEKVTDAAVQIIARTWSRLRDGTAPRMPMDLKEGSYFGGRKASDGLIDWSLSAVQIYNLIRGVTHPYPGAFMFMNGKKVIVWSAMPLEGCGEQGRILSYYPLQIATGKGLLEIKTLQIEGEPEQSAEEFCANYPHLQSFQEML
jgi:methionyl-tRNA formyltransferase